MKQRPQRCTWQSSGTLFCVFPYGNYLMQFRPVILIGDDQVIQNLFGDRGAGHRLGQRQGLPQFLVAVLDIGFDDQAGM